MIRTLFAIEFIQPNRPEERFDDEFSFVMDCNRFASEYNQFIVVWDWLFRSELSPTHSIRFLNPVMNKMYRTYYNSSGFPSGESRKEDVWWHLETGKLIKGAFHLYQWPMVFLIRPITKPSNCTQPGPPPVLHRMRQDNYSPTKPPIWTSYRNRHAPGAREPRLLPTSGVSVHPVQQREENLQPHVKSIDA